MRAYLTLTRRELGSFFVSVAGYVIIAAALFQMGLSFVILVKSLHAESTPMPITELFYITPFFWLILLLSAPIITMRLFALEKYSGTFETLMTTPVGDLSVVLSKFTAALLFYLVMWLPLLGFILFLRKYMSDPAVVDFGAIASTFFGIFLLGCLYMALGCFASALTRNQIIAAMISFALGISLFLLSFLSESLPLQAGWTTALFNHIAMVEHMQDFARGVVDTRHVIFYLSLTAFFLFLTYRAVESRRWK
jgi:ABC-2 type transport system permease protein